MYQVNNIINFGREFCSFSCLFVSVLLFFSSLNIRVQFIGVTKKKFSPIYSDFGVFFHGFSIYLHDKMFSHNLKFRTPEWISWWRLSFVMSQNDWLHSSHFGRVFWFLALFFFAGGDCESLEILITSIICIIFFFCISL